MRRKILMFVLALGAIGGYASGFAHLHHARMRCMSERAGAGCAEVAPSPPPGAH